MQHKTLFLLFFFLFFFLIKPVHAFTQFNSNPDFTANQQGIFILNQCIDKTFTTCNAWNPATWWQCIWQYIGQQTLGLDYAWDVSLNTSSHNDSMNITYTGFLQLDASENCTWTGDTNNMYLQIKLLNDTSYYNEYNVSSVSAWDFDQNAFFLPKNQEGIIFLRMLVNQTTFTFKYGSSIQWYDSLGNMNQTYLTGINSDRWGSFTLLIPANIYEDRYINVFLDLKYEHSTTTAATTIKIDRFSFYTYDIIDPRASYFTNEIEESTEYCGSDLTQKEFNKVSQTLKLAYMIENNTADNNYCCVFQSGNYTIGRRCIPYTISSTAYPVGMYYMRDLAWVTSFGVNDNHMLIKRLSTTSITYDFYENTCWYTVGGSGFGGYLQFNGAGTLSWNINTTIGSGLYICNDKYVGIVNDRTVDISIRNISGTKFNNTRDSLIGSTVNVPFVNFQLISNSICTCSDNIQTCIDESGLVINTDCGSYGCDPSNQYCNLPSIVKTYGYGTFCYKTANPTSTNTRGYIFYSLTNGPDGVYGTCTMDEYCSQYTTKTIKCKTIANDTTTTYIDENGDSVAFDESSQYASNVTAGAEFFGIQLGYGALGGRYMIGILLLAVMMLGINGVGMVTKSHITIPRELNILFFVLLIVAFTFMGLFDWYLVIIIILIALLLNAKVLAGIFGSGGG